MTDSDRKLLRHLTLALVVKLALLAGLWWVFIRGAAVPVDPAAAAARISSGNSPQEASK